MQELNISHNHGNSKFGSSYHDSMKCGGNGNTHEEYIFHNVDVFTTLKINGNEYQVVYQAGEGFYNDDYSMPYEDIALSEEGGTDPTIALIDKIGYELSEATDAEAKEILSDNSIEFTPSDVIKIYEYMEKILKPEAEAEYGNLIELSSAEIESSLQQAEREAEREREMGGELI